MKSGAKISRLEALRLAEDTIKRIHASRQKEVDEVINELTSKDQRSFLDILFGKPKRFMTKEEALARLKKPREGNFGCSDYHFIQITCLLQEETANKIINLVRKTSENDIWISAEDLWAIT